MANPGSSVQHGTQTNLQAYITYTGSTSDTAVTYTFTLIDRLINNVYSTNKSTVSKNSHTYTFTAKGATQASGSCPSADTDIAKGTQQVAYTIRTVTVSFDRGTSASTQSVSLAIKSTISGNTSTATLSLTIPARTSHTVSYNSNGGSGTIASQTKYYGINITLSDGSGFTRTNHTLVGWNTASDGSGQHYSLGQTYSVNSTTNLTLYAEWELNAVGGKGKVSGSWRDGIYYAKVNGSIVTPHAGYVKVNGSWKQIES